MLAETEKTLGKRNIEETLESSDVPMWYLDMEHNVITNLIRIVCDAFVSFLESYESKYSRDLTLKRETIEVFKKFTREKKVPSVVTYLKYDVGKEQGTVRNQDVDATFCTVLLYLSDTSKGRLHCENTDLPEIFNPGDVVFMNPRQLHEVTKCARDRVRKVLVFTV